MDDLFVFGKILKKEGGIVPTDKMVNYLLNIFNSLNEWGHTVLYLLSKFTLKDQQQIFDIMNIL